MTNHVGRWWTLALLVGVIALAVPPTTKAVNTVDSVLVVPNPYSVTGRTHNAPSNIQGFERILFVNLPNECTIRIYTSAGNLVSTIEHKGGADEAWSGRNADNQYIVSDVYIYVVESPTLGKKIGKFLVVR